MYKAVHAFTNERYSTSPAEINAKYVLVIYFTFMTHNHKVKILLYMYLVGDKFYACLVSNLFVHDFNQVFSLFQNGGHIRNLSTHGLHCYTGQQFIEICW
jgi:general stress protein CsbA